MNMEIALLIGSLGILGIAANRWGVDSRDSDVSLFESGRPHACEMLVAIDEPVLCPEMIPNQRTRSHLRLTLHGAA
jgi:hypothetical protein